MGRLLFFLAILMMAVQLEGKTRSSSIPHYHFTNEPIDVVIPCVEKDKDTLEACIKGIRENCQQVRNVYIVSSKKLTDQAIWINEKKFPFNKKKVSLYLFKGDKKRAREYLTICGNRAGWYLQQLLKFYAPFVISKISSNVLILDADTIFLKPVIFQNAMGGALFNPSNENHAPYFEHADKLTGGLVKRVFPSYSGISHHMLFQKSILKDLFRRVEKAHHKKFWKVFCSLVDLKDIHVGASEYEIYFNFALSRTNKVAIRVLKWANVSRLSEIPHFKAEGFDYVSCHDWIREN